MPPVLALSILVALLFAACLALLWRYADWPRGFKNAASALLSLFLLAMVIPAALYKPPYELEIQPLPSVPAVVMAGVETGQIAPTPSEPAPAESETAPVEPESAPVESTTAPVEPDAVPAPSESVTAPAPSESAPVEPEAAPSPSPEPSAVTPAPAEAPPPTSDLVRVSYVLNTSTKKFHRSTCSDVKRIKESNYATTDSRAYAIESGYDPCKRCNP